MEQKSPMPRYSILADKNPREIVLLRGSGCRWRKCSFCDYHLDYSKDEAANQRLNQAVLSRVTGLYQRLEVINSGSFCELDAVTMDAVRNRCTERGIRQIHFESHWMYRNEIPRLRQFFAEKKIEVKIKMGVETFDYDYRESILKKGLTERDPEKIARHADEICLLFGLEHQTAASMGKDIETGLQYFERICINMMSENSTSIKPCKAVTEAFLKELYPSLRKNPRVDILLNNTDFGVGL